MKKYYVIFIKGDEDNERYFVTNKSYEVNKKLYLFDSRQEAEHAIFMLRRSIFFNLHLGDKLILGKVNK